MKKIFIRYHAFMDEKTLVSENHDAVTLIVYLDKQANGATALTTGLWETTQQNQSFRNLSNVNRFVNQHTVSIIQQT